MYEAMKFQVHTISTREATGCSMLIKNFSGKDESGKSWLESIMLLHSTLENFDVYIMAYVVLDDLGGASQF